MFWILATFTNEWHPFWKNILNICFSFYTCILWVTFVPFEVLQNWAVTEMVPYLIWAPDFFGPQEIWALHEKHYIAFSCRDQISRWPKKSDPNEIGDHFSYCDVIKINFVLVTKKILWIHRCIKLKHLGLQKGFYPTFHPLISDGFRWRRFRVRISIVQLFRGSRRYLVPRQKSWLRRRWGHIWRRPLTDNSYGWSNKRQVCLTLLWVRP